MTLLSIYQRPAAVLALLFLSSGPSPATRPIPQWVSIRGYSDFSDVRAQLQVLVDMNGHVQENRLCVVGQKIGTYLQADVYWPEENKLILWIPNRDDAQAMVDSKRYLDLKRDVVAGRDVRGSTYLLTRSEARATIEACRVHGQTFAVQRSFRAGDHG